ncbi:MAG: hypothetical protein J6B89_01795 [Bacilli bacterium]|nr:hypothetical protein [Bacilli bacterium]
MKDKNIRVIMMVAVVALICIMGIGFAALSTTLSINGAGTVKASSWNVEFDNLSAVSKTGTAVEVTAPTISDNNTHIGDYDVTFTTPGDSISYSFDVKNTGTFNAEISSIVVSTPSCTGSGDTATVDATNVCNNLTYKLTYTDSGALVSQGDTLDSNSTKNMTLSLSYNSAATANLLPTNDVAISNLEVTIIYSQR